MKTRRENDIATSLLQAGNMIHKSGLNVQPEGLYDVDGRRCDARFEANGNIVFLEIFAGKDLSYMRNRMLMRDSRIFNRRLGKTSQTIHLICNDQAFNAFINGSTSNVERRLVSISEELDHYTTHNVSILPKNPNKKQFRFVANSINSFLGF